MPAVCQSPKSLRATTAELDDLRAPLLGWTDQIVRAESAISRGRWTCAMAGAVKWCNCCGRFTVRVSSSMRAELRRTWGDGGEFLGRPVHDWLVQSRTRSSPDPSRWKKPMCKHSGHPHRPLLGYI